MENKRLLTSEELWQLRQEITLNSLFYNDYENSFNIDTYYTLDFFNGYCDYLQEIMEENNITDNQFFDYLKDYDNKYNLYDYYNYYYCTEYFNNVMVIDEPKMKMN